ncbi:substrate-binding periplasmic protein [Hahella ganghwensis]|uniref:substrate-binding periplasmic protein n=1 Tax=Hahella ganghwensis TaxID=286420 RepID=UPI0012F91F2C|nr:transporter substrate-binding domain-containing protein [Hahella ganghwensis]
MLYCGTARPEIEIRLVTGEFPPFTGENLPNGGFFTELVSTVFYELGYAIDISFAPWKRGYQDTLEGKYSATFPYSYSQERARHFKYSEPLRINTVHIFVHRDSLLRYQELKDLHGARFCTGLGYNIFPPLREARDMKIISITTVPKIENCFRMIANRRMDATFLNSEVGWEEAFRATGDADQFKTLEKPIYVVREYLILSKEYPESEMLLNNFNTGLNRLIENGRYQEIADHHGVKLEH